MKKGFVGVFLLVVLFVIILVGVGYFFFFNKRTQIDRAIRPDTSTENVSIKDEMLPRDEITEKGYDMEVTVSPSVNNTISGSVDITASNVSDQAAGVGFFITQDEQGYMKEGMPNIGMDQVGSDGWGVVLDTNEFENGKYFINIIAYPAGGEGNPLGIAQIPVEISN